MDIFKYGDEELDYLKKKDELLGAVIERVGMIEREVTPDLFTALAIRELSRMLFSIWIGCIPLFMGAIKIK